MVNSKIKFIANNIFPSLTLGIFEMKGFYVKRLVKYASKQIKPEQKILDAGDGSCQWKKYFKHANYESTDFEQIFNQGDKKLHDFICDIKKIPKEDNTYDAILNIEVLEHVPEPLKVLKEFYRILKPSGKLFLTTPQSWAVHGYPYNYFNFTKGGLEYLFKEAGFKKYKIYPKGGIVKEIAVKLKELPIYILSQYFKVKKVDNKIKIKKKNPLAIILLPLFLISWIIFQVIIPLLAYPIDKLDKEKDFTIGYCCVVEKGISYKSSKVKK